MKPNDAAVTKAWLDEAARLATLAADHIERRQYAEAVKLLRATDVRYRTRRHGTIFGATPNSKWTTRSLRFSIFSVHCSSILRMKTTCWMSANFLAITALMMKLSGSSKLLPAHAAISTSYGWACRVVHSSESQ